MSLRVIPMLDAEGPNLVKGIHKPSGKYEACVDYERLSSGVDGFAWVPTGRFTLVQWSARVRL